MTGLMIGLRRSSKALLKAKFASKNGRGHCLVCCLSDPLHISESWWNLYIWEVCVTNWWDTLKTAVPAANIGQHKGPKSSPQQCWTAHCTTNASKVEWIGLQKLNGFCLIHHIYLTSRQPTTTCSSSILTTFCRENYSTTSLRQKIVSKSLSNPEAWIFMLQAKMCWL